ncbi:MAG: hypothetical protein EXQ87_04965 [Alphaproteobacteria bacterium]|nr:hypothetical protein [Alphaproteobacteria bacterium]
MAEQSLQDLLKRVRNEARRLEAARAPEPRPAPATASAGAVKPITVTPDAVPTLLAGIDETLDRFNRRLEERRQAQMTAQVEMLRIDQHELIRAVESAFVAQLDGLARDQQAIAAATDAAIALRFEALFQELRRVEGSTNGAQAAQVATLRQEQLEQGRVAESKMREILDAVLTLRDRINVLEATAKTDGDQIKRLLRRRANVTQSAGPDEWQEPWAPRTALYAAAVLLALALAAVAGGVAAIRSDSFRDQIIKLITLVTNLPSLLFS